MYLQFHILNPPNCHNQSKVVVTQTSMIFCFHFNLHTANLSVLDPIFTNLLLLISPAQVIIN